MDIFNEGDPQSTTSSQLRSALSSWDNEGGAWGDESGAWGDEGCAQFEQVDTHYLTNTELVQLRCRVIALENIVIALVADGSERQETVIREMATYISPRSGFTPHPLTLRAAALMEQLVDRAVHFREV